MDVSTSIFLHQIFLPDTFNKTANEVLEFKGHGLLCHLQSSIGAVLKKICSKYECSSTTTNIL